ncbi:hypothetical protein FRX31_016710 [Thalictrum thalictroides]|uniref:Uncharacterized protein n=1 Tax=Thalictrum thalictroides TaxID=46969 RepID=A0A7J6W8E8_THATH|nr:hypothetical protein FRX31_016710 [Thalictrum thalictroides]
MIQPDRYYHFPQINNEKIPDVEHQLKAIAGSVAVITADINALTFEMETIQLGNANREEHVNNTSQIAGEESPDNSSIHKKTLHGGSKDKCRPMINGLIPSINCIADAVKSNRD